MNLRECIDTIMIQALFKEEELVNDQPPPDAKIVQGLVHKFAFHPQRIADKAGDVAELIAELNPTFHKSDGGGWSFLNLCVDRHRHQWGEHADCEKLLVLAIATDQGGFSLPRDMWPSLPGGMPYVWLGS